MSLLDNPIDWFQVRSAPTLPGGSYESETTKLGNIDRQDEKPGRRKRSAPVRFSRSQPGGRRAGAPFPVDRGGGSGAGLRPDWGGRDARAPRRSSSHRSCPLIRTAVGCQAAARVDVAEPSRFV